jgi:hypothetical protein
MNQEERDRLKPVPSFFRNSVFGGILHMPARHICKLKLIPVISSMIFFFEHNMLLSYQAPPGQQNISGAFTLEIKWLFQH